MLYGAFIWKAKLLCEQSNGIRMAESWVRSALAYLERVDVLYRGRIEGGPLLIHQLHSRCAKSSRDLKR